MSYVSQQFLLFDNSSLANFKNWAQAISTAFSSSGWTQTADTGQVNWSTIVSVPATANFVYEIWQPSDALQTSSTKFFVKVKYGTGAGSPAGPRFQLQVGTSTDGAGNLTGLTSTNWEGTPLSGAGQGSLITYDCYFSGDTDRFTMMLWRSLPSSLVNSGAPVIHSIERTHNTDGSNSGDGVTSLLVANTGAVGTRTQNTICFGIGSYTLSGSWYAAIRDLTSASGAFNNNIPVSPTFPIYGKIGNPLTTISWVASSDVAEGCIFNTTLYGATRTYVATGQTNANSPFGGTSKCCVRFD